MGMKGSNPVMAQISKNSTRFDEKNKHTSGFFKKIQQI